MKFLVQELFLKQRVMTALLPKGRSCEGPIYKIAKFPIISEKLPAPPSLGEALRRGTLINMNV